MRPNDVLHKDYHVEPLKQGETATFVLVNLPSISNRRSVQENRLIPTKPGPRAFPGEAVFNDLKQGKKIRIGNVVSESWNEQKERMDPVTASVWFDKGRLTVDHNQNETYTYLMRYPKNASNPFRDQRLEAAFKLLDPRQEVAKDMAAIDMEDQAIDFVRSADYKDLLACVEQLPTPLSKAINKDRPIEEIRYNLRSMIKGGNAIEIIRASNDEESKVQVQVLEAEKFRFIQRIEARREWVYTEDKKVIIQVPVDQDIVKYLVKYLRETKPGKEVYQNIVEFLRKMKV